MKIAIPTDDGLKISPDFRKAKGFLILTVKFGELTDETMQWDASGEPELSPEGLLAGIRGCSVLIVKKIDDLFCRILGDNAVECIITKEEIITNILVRYLENEFRKASDTCCCP